MSHFSGLNTTLNQKTELKPLNIGQQGAHLGRAESNQSGQHGAQQRPFSEALTVFTLQM